MKWLMIAMTGCFMTINADAMFLQHQLNDDYSLVSIQSDNYLKESAGLYSIDIVHQGRSIGLVKDLRLGSSWRSSFGLLLADETISISTVRSDLQVGGRLFDLNKILSVNARLEFLDIIPFVSIAYQYSNDSRNMTFDFVTGLKLLKLVNTEINFGQDLGILLESNQEISTRLKQDALDSLQQFYVLPVINFKFQYLID